MASPEFALAHKRWVFLRRWGWLIGMKITARNLRKFMAKSPKVPLPEGATETRVDANGVPCAWVVAEGADPAKRILYLHGGGYVAGSVDTHTTLGGYISKATGQAVLVADYRLAPEHKYPAAVNDADTAFDWMLTNGPDGPGEASRSVLMGDSAGGGLALGTVLSRKDQGKSLPDHVVALSAWADMTVSSATMQSRAKADLICRQDWLDECAQLYVGDDRKAPYASPVFGDFAGFPAMLLQVGDAEVLLGDSEKLTEVARAAGVHVTLEIWPEMLHDWHLMAPAVPEANAAIGEIADFLNGTSLH
ncbi:MAG: alpha/beta hydrolase [Alphaproteobacteria bacterium]